MRRLTSLSALVAAVALGAGCGDTVQAPEETGESRESAASFATGGHAACPIPATTVVTDEASLLAAVAAAGPGDVIGIDGLIELTTSHGGFGIVVGTDDVMITCATPGSGLFGDVGGDAALLFVTGDRVAVDRLDLDGRQTRIAYIGSGEEVSFTRNSVRCSDVCILFQGALAPYAAHNSFDATDPPGIGTFSAIQIQAGATDALVEFNDVIGSGATGIRIRSGANHTLVHNSVSGAWNSSILVVPIDGTELTGTEIKSNDLEGATDFGLIIGGQAGLVATGNDVRNNRITGAGQAGISVDLACNNTFQGNELDGNPNVGLIFNGETGANTFRGNKNVVVDDGSFDCDGDGVPDPNDV